MTHVLRVATALIFLGLVPRAQSPPPKSIDAAFVASTVKTLGDVITREYIDVDVAAAVSAQLTEHLAQGRYDAVATDAALAALVTRDLYVTSHDKHLALVVAATTPAGAEPTQAERDASRAHAVRRTNAGVKRLEILSGNIGLFELTNFFRPEEARDALATAMHALAQTDAIIFDMRANGGGSPATITLLVSYLLDSPGVPLLDIVHRAPEPTDHYSTEKARLPDSNATRPVFVLTSTRTFSGGEGFPFLLQERHRAEVIGEQTAGAANPGRPYPVNDRFDVVVPNGRVKSAIGGSNWEGAGVTPDVKTTAAAAFPTAYARALRLLIAREPAGPWRDTLERTLKTVEAAPR
jgi:retinol-binding protein 3